MPDARVADGAGAELGAQGLHTAAEGGQELARSEGEGAVAQVALGHEEGGAGLAAAGEGRGTVTRAQSVCVEDTGKHT